MSPKRKISRALVLGASRVQNDLARAVLWSKWPTKRRLLSSSSISVPYCVVEADRRTLKDSWPLDGPKHGVDTTTRPGIRTAKLLCAALALTDQPTSAPLPRQRGVAYPCHGEQRSDGHHRYRGELATRCDFEQSVSAAIEWR